MPERLYPCYLDVEELGAESETEVRTTHAWIVAGDVPRCFPPSFRAKKPAACDVGKQLFAFQREVVQLAAAVVGLDPAALWQRERTRRRKRLSLLALAATLVMATVASLAVSAIRQKQRAESLRLASSSETTSDPVDALRLGLDAVRRFPTVQAERALSRALSIQRTRAILEHPTSVYVGEFSPDGTLFATGTEDGTVALWTVATGQARTAFKGHQGNVEDLAFSPSCRWVASVGRDATLRIWDTASISSAGSYAHQGSEINRVVFVSEETFVTGTADGLVQGWNSGRAAPAWSYRAEPNALVSPPSRDGLLIVAGPSSEAVISATTGTLVTRLRRGASFKADSSPLTLPQPVFSPDGKRAAARDPAGALRVWDVAAGGLTREVRLHATGINRLSWAPDSKRLGTASEDGLAFVVDVESGDTLGELKHTRAVEDVEFSRDGYLVVTAGDDNRAIAWSWTGEPRYELLGHRSGVWRASFSPDGATIATVSLDSTARLWSTVTGRERTIITHPGRIDEVATSGPRLLVRGDRHLAVADALTGRTSATKSTPRSFRSMSVAVQPGIVALQSRDHIVHVLDVATLTERCATPKGNPAIVHRIALSADGTTLLVAGAELPTDPYRNVLQLWDAATCTFSRTVARLPADALGVLFAPTGKAFVAWLQRPFLLFGPSPDDALLVPAPDRFQITRAALSADGQRLATAREK